MARLGGKMGLALWAVAALLCATFDRASASDAGPKISFDGRVGAVCNPELQCRGREYDLPADVMSALEKGPVPVVVIGLFDSTFQGKGSFLGGLTDIKNVAVIASPVEDAIMNEGEECTCAK